MAARHVDSAGHQIVAYDVASADDDPAVARSRARDALMAAGEPDWQPHASMPDFASELAELRRSTRSPAALAAAPPDSWVDRQAIVGTPERARETLRSPAHAADREMELE
jgi:5,10-methylenetetrahydromethanopterin reductase